MRVTKLRVLMIIYLVMVLLDGGLSLHVGSVGVLKSNGQLVHVCIKLLLLPQIVTDWFNLDTERNSVSQVSI